jgi:hypothetical protein
VKYGDSFVKRVDSVHYLGVILDGSLSGQAQASEVIKKVASRVSFLYRHAHVLCKRTRRTLCLALISPLFDYCSSSWYAGLNAKCKSQLNVLQRKMMRFILGLDSRAHIGVDEYKSLSLLTVPERVKYFRLVHMFKIFKGVAPSYLSQNFQRVTDLHCHRTRGSEFNYHLSKSDSQGPMYNSFSYTAKKDWNVLPSEIKSAPSMIAFKRDLMIHLSCTN